jgi:hypothetical protein
MSLSEQAKSTRLAWEAGDREEGLSAAMDLAYEVRGDLLAIANGVADQVSYAELIMERIAPGLCALAEQIATAEEEQIETIDLTEEMLLVESLSQKLHGIGQDQLIMILPLLHALDRRI